MKVEVNKSIISTTIVAIRSGEFYIDTDSIERTPPVLCTAYFCHDFQTKELAQKYISKFKESIHDPVIESLTFTFRAEKL